MIAPEHRRDRVRPKIKDKHRQECLCRTMHFMPPALVHRCSPFLRALRRFWAGRSVEVAAAQEEATGLAQEFAAGFLHLRPAVGAIAGSIGRRGFLLRFGGSLQSHVKLVAHSGILSYSDTAYSLEKCNPPRDGRDILKDYGPAGRLAGLRCLGFQAGNAVKCRSVLHPEHIANGFAVTHILLASRGR